MWILVRGRQYTKFTTSAIRIFAKSEPYARCQNWQWQKVIREKHNGNILKKFIGTEEESSLMEQLQNFESEKMINLVMQYCNGAEPVLFSDAYINLRGRKQEDREKATLLLPYKQLFKDWLFKDVLERGLTAVPPHHREIFLCLLDFFEKKAFHEKAISNFLLIQRSKKEEKENDRGRGIHLTAVMAKHVFSYLTPDHSYIIDERAASQPKICPCGIKGCDKVLNFGDTSVGSNQAWHGSLDIILNHKVPVILVTDTIDEVEVTDTIDEAEVTDTIDEAEVTDTIDEAEVTDTIDEAEVTDTIDEVEVTDTIDEVEVTDTIDEVEDGCCGNGYDIDSDSNDTECSYVGIDADDIMYKKKIQDQILSQAITNAFVQLNTSPNLKGMFIPSLGCSQDYIFAFLYDPENDVLLKTPDFEICQKMQDVTLENDMELNKMGLIHAWMFLNFTALLKCDVAPKLKMSRFHDVVGDSLNDYRKACKRLQFSEHNDGYRQAYEIMYRNGITVDG